MNNLRHSYVRFNGMWNGGMVGGDSLVLAARCVDLGPYLLFQEGFQLT